MRPRGAIVVTFLAGVLIVAASSFVDCAAPTQIVVEVYSDACEGSGKPQSIHRTGIAVGTADVIDQKLPNALRDGCERPATGGVGTLTIYPSGATNAEVAIKVVAGVDTTPDHCVAPGYEGCIAQRRLMKFIPNVSQHAIVRLSLACLNRTCPGGTTCDNGVCKKDEDVLVDGGTRPDAAVVEAGVVEAGPAPIVDAGGPDACAGCTGTCDQASCNVQCSGKGCTGELCAPTLPCTITCSGNGKCPNIACTTSAACAIACNGDRACGTVACNAKSCDVQCNGAQSCSDPGGIHLDASTSAKLGCTDDKACNTASCSSPACALTCTPDLAACPEAGARPCSGGCTNWEPPNVSN